MSLTNCSACGHQVFSGATCPNCGAKIIQGTANAGCAGLIALALLAMFVVWGCSKINSHFFPPPANETEALTSAGYTDIEGALSHMDCHEDEYRVENFSAFKGGEYVLGVVCERKGGGKHYRIQSRSWNEHADGPARDPK